MKPKYETSYYDPNGFFGFMNLPSLSIYKAGDIASRPKFPPINSKPSITDVYKNFGKSEIGISVAGIPIISTIAYIISFAVTKDIPTKGVEGSFIWNKKIVYRLGFYGTALIVLPYFCFINSYLKLTGQIYNGQNWKVQRNRFEIFSHIPGIKKDIDLQ